MPSKKKKYESRFPPARVKKIMQSDEQVGKVAHQVPIIVSKSLELFIQNLLLQTSQVTKQRNARTLTPNHLKASIMSVAEFGFLRELASTIPDVNGKDDNDNGNGSGDPYSDGGQQPTSSSATSSAADIAHRDHHHHHNVRPNSHHPLLDLPSSSSSSSIYAHHHQDHSTPTSTTTIPTNQSLNNLTQFLHGPPIDLSSSPHHDKNNNSPIRALAPSTSSMFVPMSVATATTASVVPKPAAKRGRPRKRPLPEESIVQKPVAHPIMVCFSSTGDAKKVSKTSKSSSAPQPPPPSSTFAGPLNLSSKPSSSKRTAPRPPPPAIEEYDDEETEEDEPGRWLENGDDTEEDNDDDDDDTPIAGLSGRYGASTSFTPAVRPAHTSVGGAGHHDDDDEDYDS